MFSPCVVFNEIIVLRQVQSPPRESSFGVCEVQYPPEGILIRSDGEPLPFEVRTEEKDGPNDGQALVFRRRMVAFLLSKGTIPISHGTLIGSSLVL